MQQIIDVSESDDVRYDGCGNLPIGNTLITMNINDIGQTTAEMKDVK